MSTEQAGGRSESSWRCPMDDARKDPRLTEAGQRWSTGPCTERVKRETKKIMAQVQRCDETTDDEGFCPCSKIIMRALQRAYDAPAPPMGEEWGSEHPDDYYVPSQIEGCLCHRVGPHTYMVHRCPVHGGAP